jgi:hypothetical protein
VITTESVAQAFSALHPPGWEEVAWVADGLRGQLGVTRADSDCLFSKLTDGGWKVLVVRCTDGKQMMAVVTSRGPK